MAPRKVPMSEILNPNPSKAGRAAALRALKYAAKEQQKILDAAKNIK